MESTISICRENSVSSRGPFQRTSTPKSCSAARTPACTDMKNRCDVALGTTPINFLVRLWQDARTKRDSTSREVKIRDRITEAQYSGLRTLDFCCNLIRYQL